MTKSSYTFPRGDRYNKVYLWFWSVLIFLSFISILGMSNFNRAILANTSAISLIKVDGFEDNKKAFLLNEGVYEIDLSSDIEKAILLKSNKYAMFKIRKIYQENFDDSDIEFKLYKNSKDITHKTKVVLLKGDDLKIELKAIRDLKIDKFKISINYLDFENIIYLLLLMILWILILLHTYKNNEATITLLSFLIFMFSLIAEKITFKHLNTDILIAYSMFFIILILLINRFIYFCKNINKNLHIVSIIATSFIFIALMIVPLGSIIYKISFGTSLLSDELYAIFQTNTKEGFEFIWDFISLNLVLGFIFTIAIFIYATWWHKKSELKPNDKIAFYIVVILGILILSSYFKELRLPNFIDEEYKKYNEELYKFKELEEKRNLNGNKIEALKSQEGETYVVLIGESLNKHHMQVYGYERKTTPKLQTLFENKEIIKFENAYSNHVQTMPALSLALTQANQYNKKDYFESVSMIEVFKEAGFETIWLTNQSLLGEWDNLISVLANQSDKVIGINKDIGTTVKTSKHDEELLPYIENELKDSKKNRVIFVHLMGSHSGYENRFPNNFNHFKESFFFNHIEAMFDDKKRIRVRQNNYDNSVLYNDFIVSNIVDILKKQGGVNALIYLSDHGEDVMRKLGHNPSTFTFDMTQIPLILYFSKEYQEKYQEKINSLNSNKNLLFSNDLLYDTVLGIADIKTDNYEERFDLSSKNYILEDKNALTLHGKKEYVLPENHFYKIK